MPPLPKPAAKAARAQAGARYDNFVAANELRIDERLDRRSAIEMAARIRLRPILMTTAAMVPGLIPLLTATGVGAVSRFSIGLVVVAGMSIGTLLTLFVLPAVYVVLARDHGTKAGSVRTSRSKSWISAPRRCG